MPRFEIPVREYDSTFRSPGPGEDLDDCVINDRQLTVGMVRSILTRNPGRLARRFTAAIVKPTLLFVIDWSRSPDLVVNSIMHTVLRDFSVSTRIGELAQGVAYSYWHWNRGYRFVTDFPSLVAAAGILIPAGVRAPDYIMYNPAAHDIALMEAKGTRNSDHGNAMSDALRQCRAAEPFAPVMRSFGCVLTLDSPAGPGVLHIRDPRNTSEIPDTVRHDIFRRSYPSWFELAGFQEAADWCRTPLEQAERSSRYIGLTKENPEVKDPLRQLVAQSLGFNSEEVRFNLHPEVARALGSFSAFERLDWDRVKVSKAENSDRPGSPLHFPDGTSIT